MSLSDESVLKAISFDRDMGLARVKMTKTNKITEANRLLLKFIVVEYVFAAGGSPDNHFEKQ